MNRTLKFIAEPTNSHIEEIKRWLIEEDRDFNEGFYCNWNAIYNGFKNNQLICINHLHSPIGFALWHNTGFRADIEIFTIKRNYRDRSIGKLFFNEIRKFLKTKKILTVLLICYPSESEFFWKRLNFQKFPDLGYNDPELTYYLPLIETLGASTNNPTNNKLELWNIDSGLTRNKEPEWIWHLEFKKGTNKLIKPIIQPCNFDWNLKWSRNGQVIREKRVKRFAKNNNQIEYSPFLFIESLFE